MINIKINKQLLLNILILAIFVFGLIIRIKFFVSVSDFEDDECRLALALSETKNVFSPLIQAQSAPPIFLALTKFFTYIFGFDEKVYKLLPLISSIAALAFSFKLFKEYLNNKFGIILAFLLFAVNVRLIYYSFIFKQYSTDVLIAVLCLYFLPKIKLENLTPKKTAILSVILIILPYISLPSLFFIGAFLCFNFNKKLIYPVIPFLISLALYYIFILHPSSINMNTSYPDYWQDGFLKLTIKDFFALFTINLKFLFVPNTYSLFQLVLFFSGIIYSFKEKRFQFLFVALILILFSSFAHLYPFCGRVALYSSVIFIIYMLKPIDISSKKLMYFTALMLVLSFYKYCLLIPTLKTNCYTTYSPEKLVTILKNEYDANSDYILTNAASTSSYIYYSKKLNFYTDNISELQSGNELNESLLMLSSNKNYWIFLIKDYPGAPNQKDILNWVSKQRTIKKYQDKSSYLIYLKVAK